MANAQLGPVLRHIRKLVAAQQTKERTDVQLLHAFTAHNDHSAFAALMHRHGPLVLGVCRHVLHHVQDAEDAFQATFLVLARKAASIRKGEALVSWLHGVAYRMAMNAKRNAARRRQHEGRAKPVPPTNPSWEVAWREVQTLLDEEIQRLPEKYRAPFLLCCLENHSRAEAARLLGLKEGTVWSRLAQARKQLQQRLARRGVTLSAVLATAALSQSAGTAAVPNLLVETTARAAALYAAGQPTAGGLISAEVATLVKGVTQTMLVTKLQIAATLLLAGTLVATGAGLLARQSAVAAPAAPQEKADAKSASGLAPAEAAVRSRTAEPDDFARQSVVIRGLVLDPEGKPAAGAKLYLAHNSFKSKPDLLSESFKAFAGGPHSYLWTDDPPEKVNLPLQATTGADGRFSFTAQRRDLGHGTLVVARLPGHGPDWAELGSLEKDGGITLQLARDDVPIQGRVLDLEGQPVVGVAVTLLRVEKPDAKSSLPALDGAKKTGPNQMMVMRKMLGGPAEGAPGAHLGAEVLEVPTVVRTGADGRFRLTGIGRDRLVRLRLQGPSIENTYVYVQTRPEPAPIRPETATGRAKGKRVYHATFDFVAGPNQPLVGTVREKGSGKPLAGITVHTTGFAFFDDGWGGAARTTTDAQGRYRLEGAGKAVHFVVAGAIPYFSALKRVEPTSGLEPTRVDIELERGVVVRGRLTETATGKPVRGLVSYYAQSDNPHLKDVTSLSLPSFVVDGRGEVGPDGSFTVVALPGPGLLGVWADDDRFMRAEIEGWQGEPLKTVPFPINPIMFHAIVPINPVEKAATSTTCDIILEPGRTLTGSVVGPDGQPLTGVLVAGLTAVLPAARYQTRLFEQPPYQKLETATFTAYGLNPRQPRTLVLLHPELGLGKVQTVRGDETGPLTIRLEPVGALAGRVVDAEGRPWAGLGLTVFVSVGKAGDLKTLPYEALGGGAFLMPRGELFTRWGTTDTDGKFHIQGLIPGLKYQLQPPPTSKTRRDRIPLLFPAPPGLTVASGQTKDLGEIQSFTTPDKLAKEQRDE
ncbi:MAG: sigma-70 family RNA polymerase sigma factor [Gemmataceae bacterium]|nr:sigma-70 family RNA polymerase sigma factor [Gemmataceae bacterium]